MGALFPIVPHSETADGGRPARTSYSPQPHEPNLSCIFLVETGRLAKCDWTLQYMIPRS